MEEKEIALLCREFKGSTHTLARSFEAQLQVISGLKLMVAMDSGNAHLAAMYGVPTITLWGNTHPFAGFSPFLQDPENAILADREAFPLIPTSVFGKKVPKGYETVMNSISPEMVANKMSVLFAAHRPAANNP